MLLVFNIVAIAFGMSFYTFINNHTLQGCIEGFEKQDKLLYGMVLIMLNMVNFTNYNIEKIELLFITHVVYTFVVSIMLINFFIAVMTDGQASMSKHRKLTQKIQRNIVACQVEYYCKWFLRTYYKYMTRHVFSSQENDIFIVDRQLHLNLQS